MRGNNVLPCTQLSMGKKNRKHRQQAAQATSSAESVVANAAVSSQGNQEDNKHNVSCSDKTSVPEVLHPQVGSGSVVAGRGRDAGAELSRVVAQGAAPESKTSPGERGHSRVRPCSSADGDREHGGDEETRAGGQAAPPNRQTADRRKENPPCASPKQQALVPASTVELPRRPGYGTKGKQVRLVVNCFPMAIKGGELYHYDVDIKASNKLDQQGQVKLKGSTKYRCLGTRVNRLIIESLAKQKDSIFKGDMPAFDGRKNIYLRKRLAEDAYTETVSFDETDKFVVTIKLASVLSLNAIKGGSRDKISAVMQAIHCILKHGPTMTFTPIGRSFFETKLAELGGGKEVWLGFTPSVHLATNWKPILNVNITATTFYKNGPLVEFIGHVTGRLDEILRGNGTLCPGDIRKVESIIKNAKVVLTHLPYKPSKRVLGLTREPASRVGFMEDGTQTFVADYFRRKYGGLRYPNLPCVITGNKDKQNYYPVEFCELPQNMHCKKLDPRETAQMIRQTAIAPQERFKAIENTVRSLIADKNSVNKNFGIDISPQFIHVTARELEAPEIVLKGDSVVQPTNGQWSLENRRLLEPAEIKAWGAILFSKAVRDDHLSRFLKAMRESCEGLGITLPEPKFQRKVGKPDGLQDLLQWAADKVTSKQKGWQAFVLIVLDDRKDYGVSLYEEIKLICDNKLGLKTQCVKVSSVFKVATDPRRGSQLVTNLCLKINTKCGGVNNSFRDSICNGSLAKSRIFSEPVIILGADVNHPGVDKMHQPSFAALVGSLDKYPSKYYASVQVQEKAQCTNEREIIKDLKKMVMDTMRAFYRNTRQKPQKIIFYRDGVSEGQFEQVLHHELTAIREACTALERDYKPRITFIIVQKRHSFRLKNSAPLPSTGANRHGNVKPGTVLDTDVTHPVDFDFFLCSHAGIQGTSRPGYYYVIHDDNSFSADDLQELTYSLCHTYARCARSVSIPAPVYYAHWVAFRAHQHAVASIRDDASSTVSSDFAAENLQKYIEAVAVNEEFKTSMYFT